MIAKHFPNVNIFLLPDLFVRGSKSAICTIRKVDRPTPAGAHEPLPAKLTGEAISRRSAVRGVVALAPRAAVDRPRGIAIRVAVQDAGDGRGAAGTGAMTPAGLAVDHDLVA